jgi:hypothetical protein
VTEVPLQPQQQAMQQPQQPLVTEVPLQPRQQVMTTTMMMTRTIRSTRNVRNTMIRTTTIRSVRNAIETSRIWTETNGSNNSLFL